MTQVATTSQLVIGHNDGVIKKTNPLRKNKKIYTAIVIITLLTIILGVISFTKRLTPNDAPILQSTSNLAFSTTDGDNEDVDCVNIGQQPDPCDFVTTNSNCAIDDGIINWLNFRYCILPKRITTPRTATFLVTSLMVGVLVIVLNALGDTADVFFVTALQRVASEMNLSPAVAGISFVSMGNASPDLITSIVSVKSGDLPLVLGALAGACVCLSFLVLGSALASAPAGKTTLPSFQFFRNVVGYVITIGAFMIISARGVVKLWSSLFLIGIYAVYLAANVIYLQRQEAKLREARKKGRKLKFLKQFKSFNNFDEQSQSLLTGLKPGDDGMGSDNDDDAKGFLPGSDVNHLGGVNSGPAYLPPALFSSKSEQTATESQYCDLDVINAVDMADHHQAQHESRMHHHKKEHEGKHAHIIADAEQIDSTPTEDSHGVDGAPEDDDEVDVDETTYMSGLTWPNPEWEVEKSMVKRGFSKMLWFLSFPFSLLRWMSIPSTEVRPDQLVGAKKLLFFFSPFFLCVFLLFMQTDGFFYDKEDQLLWILLPSVGAGVTALLGLFYNCIISPSTTTYNTKREELRLQEETALSSDNHLSQEQLAHLALMHLQYDLDLDDCDAKPAVMTAYQIFFSLLAFVASIAWLSFFAGEVVNVLGSLGLMFGVSSSILGLTVLALGNSLPDLIAGVSLAAKGNIGISYAAIFGAPVLSSSFGFGIATLIKFITDKNGFKPITFEVSPQLWLCFGATIFGLLSHCVIFPLTKFTPPKWYGIVLVVAYVVFLAIAVVLEVCVKK